MRAALIIAILIVFGFAYHLFSTATEKRSSRPNQVSPEYVTETALPFERRIAQDKVRPDAPDGKGPQQPGQTRAQIDNDSSERGAEPSGPFEVSLGQHTVHFRNHPGFAMKLRLGVVVQSKLTRKEVLLNRRKLTRMLYFLGSNRRLEGARGDAGRDRLISDLSTRFSNVIRSGAVDAVQIEEYEVVEVPKTNGD